MTSSPGTGASVRVPRPYRRRRKLARVVAVIGVGGVTTAAAILTAVLLELFFGRDEVLTAAIFGFTTGSAAAAAAVAMMPVIRWASGRRSEARLLIAASPAHPLLRALMLNAPGTYAHSVAVANLAETAADEIGANALLARVGAYYHDVGKVSMACWFFENLQTSENPHDGRTPAESVAIITQHVRDGERLAREYKLPQRVEAIVRQHHGTSLVRYFYYKAASEGGADVFEADYRYQAEKPTSREAALVMLADASEAAVRAMRSQDRMHVDETVRKVIAEKVDDEQLEASGMSDEDVSRTSEIFIDMLTSMYHARCEYPEALRPVKLAETPEEVAGADQHREQA
jgi:putative nucleotidyltransferase with HDIG domain